MAIEVFSLIQIFDLDHFRSHVLIAILLLQLDLNTEFIYL